MQSQSKISKPPVSKKDVDVATSVSLPIWPSRCAQGLASRPKADDEDEQATTFARFPESSFQIAREILVASSDAKLNLTQ